MRRDLGRPLTARRCRAALAVMLIAALAAAAPARAQSAGQQPVRPQPPPAQKPAGTPTQKPAGTPAGKPEPGAPQAKGAKKPPPKKKAPPQTSKVWKGRGFAVVSVGAQVMGPAYESTATFKLHAEDATLNANASIEVGPAFGARGGMRVWKNLALGGGLEVASTSQSLDVTGRLPHPFQFNQYRDVEGSASGLARLETLAAFELSWYAALSRRLDMFVFGGPAYIHIRQDMATRIQFTESYPYDSATFSGVETTSVSGGGFGATVGVDVSYLLSKHLGVGGELRYSYATTTLTPSTKPASVTLGGLQAAFGARLLF